MSAVTAGKKVEPMLALFVTSAAVCASCCCCVAVQPLLCLSLSCKMTNHAEWGHSSAPGIMLWARTCSGAVTAEEGCQCQCEWLSILTQPPVSVLACFFYCHAFMPPAVHYSCCAACMLSSGFVSCMKDFHAHLKQRTDPSISG